MLITKSPYISTLSSCAFAFEEFDAVLPLLTAKNVDELLRQEVFNRTHLRVNNEASAKKILRELKRRYDTLPSSFWEWYNRLGYEAKKGALWYAILKTYRIAFDFHIDVTIKKWNSVDRSVTRNDLQLKLLDVAANDEYVDSWSEQTKKKQISAYLTCLRQVGMLDSKTSALRPIRLLMPGDYSYYIECGDFWYLDACLLSGLEKESIINAIKHS